MDNILSDIDNSQDCNLQQKLLQTGTTTLARRNSFPVLQSRCESFRGYFSLKVRATRKINVFIDAALHAT
jgi:hypothetical protein